MTGTDTYGLIAGGSGRGKGCIEGGIEGGKAKVPQHELRLILQSAGVQALNPPMDQLFLFDADLRALRWARAARSDAAAGFLFREGAQALADRLGFIKRTFSQIVFHGLDFGALETALPDVQPIKKILAETEIWPLEPHSCDLVLSNLQLHWVNDLPGILVQIRQSLRPDGFFSACLVGGESLFELRASLAQAETDLGLSSRPRVSPMIDLPTAADLMQRTGFALPVVDHEVIPLSYRSPLTLLKDLRAMGQTNALSAQPRGIDPHAFWPQVIAAYEALFPHPEGGVQATVDLVFLSGWAPGPGQQTPLAPGSAKQDLAWALRS